MSWPDRSLWLGHYLFNWFIFCWRLSVNFEIMELMGAKRCCHLVSVNSKSWLIASWIIIHPSGRRRKTRRAARYWRQRCSDVVGHNPASGFMTWILGRIKKRTFFDGRLVGGWNFDKLQMKKEDDWAFGSLWICVFYLYRLLYFVIYLIWKEKRKKKFEKLLEKVDAEHNGRMRQGPLGRLVTGLIWLRHSISLSMI